MAKKQTKYYPGTPECPSVSFSKKSIPSGSPDPNPMSASKKLGKVTGGPDRPKGFSLESK